MTAKFGGRVIDVTFAGDGEILEREEAVTSGRLPQAVLDWVRANFPGSDIGEAAVVAEDGSINYEIVIEAAGGEEYEALLRVDGAQMEGQEPASRSKKSRSRSKCASIPSADSRQWR